MTKLWISTLSLFVLFIFAVTTNPVEAAAFASDKNPPDCSLTLGSYDYVFVFRNDYIVSHKGLEKGQIEVSARIPAGNYSVIMESRDDHKKQEADHKKEGTVYVPQKDERWQLELRGENAPVVVGPFQNDLDDLKNRETSNPFEITVPAGVHSVAAVHAALGAENYNSVYPCVALTRKPDPANLGDFAWCDGNQNSVFDNNEKGLPGVTVGLQNGFSVQTNQDGRYLFQDLPAGDYTVNFTPPQGYQPTTSTVRNVHLNPGDDNRNQDAGFYGPACAEQPSLTSLGDFVWCDGNQNGIYDNNEKGLPGVTVHLQNGLSVQTNQDGHYLFTDLPVGSYTVNFTPPSGYHSTTSTVRNVQLTPEAPNYNQDAGFFGPTCAPPPPPACARFNLDLGRNAHTGAGVDGRYEMIEVGTGKLLATWDAEFWWADSGWIEGIKLSYEDGSWVEVFFYPNGSPPAQKLEIINPAPGTEYGWLALGMCHAIEIQFPADWAYVQSPETAATSDEAANDTAVVKAEPIGQVDSSSQEPANVDTNSQSINPMWLKTSLNKGFTIL